ncbi:MAG: DUF4340 domain-containing protein [Acidobacteriota bacterium]|nr:MAG: DUF4340 domain-containing protein [Acidobacteriota bacterium]
MSEKKKTITFAVAALVLLLLAAVTAPRHSEPDQFADLGEKFFPEFTDPNIATTLEVIEFDEATAAARPFKVTFKGGIWTIPSHHDYPADGKDQLAKTAAGMIGLNKEDFRTSNIADHESCGVIDPLDETATTLKGRGKRVTIRDNDDRILADLIFGKKLEGRADYSFVRVPGQKRVYITKTDLSISTQFADWIEPDLLKTEQTKIQKVTLQDYSINERTRSVDERGTLVLTKGSDSTWKANRMPSSEEVDTTKMDAMLRAIDELSIVGVRPKPEGLSRDLRRSDGSVPISQENLISLQEKGYYFTRDGRLLSNEGELNVETSDGIEYTLRFGEVLFGSGETVTAGATAAEQEGAEKGPGENRYLFLTASFQPNLIPEPRKPSNTNFESKPESEWNDEDRANKDLKAKHDEWQASIETGRTKADELNSHFAGWYYVISSEAFDKIHLNRSELLKKKES